MNRTQEHEYFPGENLATRENFRIYYTPQALAEMWQCNINTLYDLLRQGRLKGFKLGRDWRISESAVLAYENDPENRAGVTYRRATKTARRPAPMRLV